MSKIGKCLIAISLAIPVATASYVPASADWASAIARNVTKGTLRSLHRGVQREAHGENTDEQADNDIQQDAAEIDIVASAFESAKEIIDDTYNEGGMNAVIVLIDECYNGDDNSKIICSIIDRYGKSIHDVSISMNKTQKRVFFSDERYSTRLNLALRDIDASDSFEKYLNVLAGNHVYEGKL